MLNRRMYIVKDGKKIRAILRYENNPPDKDCRIFSFPFRIKTKNPTPVEIRNFLGPLKKEVTKHSSIKWEEIIGLEKLKKYAKKDGIPFV